MVLNLFKFLNFGSLYHTSSVSSLTRENVKKEWSKIDLLLKGRQPSQLKEALMSADKSLDNVLKDIVVGDTMGERMKDARTKFERPLYNKLWEAHKMRNSMAHEIGYEPPYYAIENSIKSFREALRYLGLKI